MTVTQVENGSNDQILWPIMIGIGVMLVVFIIIAIIAIVIIVWCLTKSKAYKEIYTVKDFNSKYVNQTLEKMKSGEFKNFNPKYKQDKCIICLENYNENDQVHITNECNHIFHSSCLKIWYSNISSSNLLCPHCNTRNIPDSEPQVSENISIVESLHIEELPQHFKSSLSSSSEEADASNLV